MASVARVRSSRGFERRDFNRSKARVGAIFYKNVVKLRRSVALLLYSFLLPSIEVSIFCSIVGNTPFDLRLAVVNEEPTGTGSFSAAFLENIDSGILHQPTCYAIACLVVKHRPTTKRSSLKGKFKGVAEIGKQRPHEQPRTGLHDDRSSQAAATMSSEPPPTTATDSANELKASIAPRRDDDRTLRPEGSQATNAYTGDGQGTKPPGDTQVLQTEDEVKIGIAAPEEVPQEAGDAPEVPQGGGHTPAVQIEGLELWYGSGAKRVDIFKGVNMRVPRGGIYALLGSSGCGKTTLLRCIMGRKHFQKGTIRVFGLQPGTPGSKIPGANVGYMPQELALYNAFSIEETLHFFARLYNLSPEQCSERAEFLIGLLDIPDRNRLVSYLSGGQKRRLSLAVSLIHSPPFLILDEPTVGIDPVLRKTIWSHLHTLSERDKMTIIITTHYIDEARLASTVSFLREGEILAEESPAKLMEVHQTRNLEEIFLRLARQEKSALPEVVIGGERSPDHERTQLSFMASTLERRPALNKKDLGRSLSRIGVMFSKNVIKFRRSFGLVLYSMLLPAIEVTMFCYVLGKVPTGLRIAVVNEEVAPPGSTTPLLSTAFVEALDRSILPQISYDTIDKGIDSVKAGVTYGVVHAKYNLTDSLVSRFSPTVPVTEPLLDFASLHAYLDMSNQQVFRTVQHYMGQALAEALPSTSINMLHFQSVLVEMKNREKKISILPNDGFPQGSCALRSWRLPRPLP
ncbi:hypothetical protein V5799_020334 [Amblyomma americanum]|uniref:ABC transporter domain-containing protein n=1 Tax=Amblyomma americanum TaxID=6943 RepID=A0AAQ4EU75_AMBAM